MRDAGIGCDRVHVRNDKYSVFNMYDISKLPGCDEFCNRMVNIPVGWWLTEEERSYIVETVNNY